MYLYDFVVNCYLPLFASSVAVASFVQNLISHYKHQRAVHLSVATISSTTTRPNHRLVKSERPVVISSFLMAEELVLILQLQIRKAEGLEQQFCRSLVCTFSARRKS
jgi:hypothetical protein